MVFRCKGHRGYVQLYMRDLPYKHKLRAERSGITREVVQISERASPGCLDSKI